MAARVGRAAEWWLECAVAHNSTNCLPPPPPDAHKKPRKFDDLRGFVVSSPSLSNISPLARQFRSHSLWVESGRIGIEGPARDVATIKPELAARKPEVMAYLLEKRQGVNTPAAGSPAAGETADDLQIGPDLCAGSVIHPDGGAYLPWGPYLAADNVRRLRAELFAMIGELAHVEAWCCELHDEIMSRAANGPLSDLLSIFGVFEDALADIRAALEVLKMTGDSLAVAGNDGAMAVQPPPAESTS